MAFEQFKYQNDYNKEKYDRIPINVPKGQKELIKTYATLKGYSSINAYVVALINADMNGMNADNSVKIDTVIQNGDNNTIEIKK